MEGRQHPLTVAFSPRVGLFPLPIMEHPRQVTCTPELCEVEGPGLWWSCWPSSEMVLEARTADQGR